MALGCSLPVVCHKEGIPSYHSLLPFTDLIHYSEFLIELDAQHVLAGNIVNLLHARLKSIQYNTSLEYLASSIRHVFTYAVPPNHLLLSFDKLHEVAPLDDALTMSLKSLLRNLCQRGHLPDTRCKGRS